LFAAVAGLAATFTACNCVVFAMLPGLACGGRTSSGRQALVALAVFTAGVVLVSSLYGMFVGLLGPDGIELYNARPVRSAQARAVFTTIGLFMLVWGALEMGFLEPVKQRVSQAGRAFFAEPTTKAGLMGLLVGLFAVGRPFPVMREFLTYAAAAGSPLYGAAVMILQGLGQIAVMVTLFIILVSAFSARLTRWATTRPQQVALTSGLALLAGGTFFVFYWGLSWAFDIGRWGFRLGWYS
jgi:sulfite exporter TauE/SafE